MLKIYSLIGAVALCAGAIIMAPSLTTASSRHDLTTETAKAGKGDRLDIATRLSCKQQSWPYLDRSCVADMRTESGSGRKVRVVSTDRR
jgi:hypothetical protein